MMLCSYAIGPLLSHITLSPSKVSDLQPVMEKVFGHVTYKPKQEQALDFILKGENVFVLLPTSGGKPLLYMLPSIVTNNLTVIVSPLKSLLKTSLSGAMSWALLQLSYMVKYLILIGERFTQN